MDKLLGGLEARTKGGGRRPVRLDLLDRLRMVLVYGMPDRVYELVPGDESRDYRRLSQEDGAPELDEVEISEESVLAGFTPEAFICLSRSRQLRRLSPHEEPVVVTHASAVALVDGSIRDVVGLSTMAFARKLREQTRSSDGRLRSEAASRLSLIQRAVVPGSRWSTSVREDGQLCIGARVEMPKARITGSMSASDDDDVDDVSRDDLQLLGEIEEEHEVDDEGIEEASADEEAEIPIDDDGGLEDVGRPGLAVVPYNGLKLSDGSLPEEVIVQRVRAVAPGHAEICIVPADAHPFDRFAENRHRGSDVATAVEQVECSFLDGIPLLIARDEETGLEIPMRPEEVTTDGRYRTVDLLADSGPETLVVAVERIDKRNRLVSASGLAESALDQSRLFNDRTKVHVDVVVAEVGDDCAWLEVLDSELPFVVRCGLDRLPRSVRATTVGARGRAEISYDKGWKTTVTLNKVPVRLAKQASGRGLGSGLALEGNQLVVVGRMPPITRRKLLSHSSAVTYRRDIDSIFSRSYRLRARLLDIEALEELQAKKDKGNDLRVRVVKLVKGGALVETSEGVTGFLPSRETWSGREEFKEGKSLKVRVKDVDMNTGKLDFTRKLPSLDPLRRIREGRVVRGTVSRMEEKFAILSLPRKAEGLLHVSELGAGYTRRVDERLEIGQKMKVRVLSASRDEAGRTSIKLSLNINMLGCDEPEFTNELGCNEPEFKNLLGCEG